MSTLQDRFKKELESELDLIARKDNLSKKKAENTKDDQEYEMTAEEEALELLKVDSYKIQAITTMLDDFENIISKNFC